MEESVRTAAVKVIAHLVVRSHGHTGIRDSIGHMPVTVTLNFPQHAGEASRIYQQFIQQDLPHGTHTTLAQLIEHVCLDVKGLYTFTNLSVCNKIVLGLLSDHDILTISKAHSHPGEKTKSANKL